METWVVQLEAASTEHTGPIDMGSVAHLLEAVGAHPFGLYAPGRCVVQLRIAGESPTEALGIALLRWEEALRTLGCPPWRIVRIEVVTPDELEREFEDDELHATFGTIRVPDEGDDVADALIRRVFSDALTNLANAEAFRAHLHATLARSRRLGTTPAVVCIGLGADYAAGGHWGTDASDDLVVRVAQCLRTNLRAVDILARVGHEEFAVVTQGSSPESALALAERLLDAVDVAAVSGHQAVAPTAKAGVALSTPTDTAEDLYERAHAALALVRGTTEARCTVWAGPRSQMGKVRLPPSCDAM